jgi:SAM-dependent methyltransferase
MAESGGSGARHTEAKVSSPGQLVWRLARTGRVHYVGMLLSDYGRQILTRKYDAFSTDRAYTIEPSGKFGPVGKLVDRYVLSFPLHEALRQRLALVVEALVDEVRSRAEGVPTVRVLSAPCGLARDVTTAAVKLRDENQIKNLELVGVDIDETGDVLTEAGRRASEAGVEIDLLREDLFAPGTELAGRAAGTGGFDVVNSIGLTAWIDFPDLVRLIARYAELMKPGATLVVDNWVRHKHSHLGEMLEMPTRYHPEDVFRSAIEQAGLKVLDVETTANGIVTLWRAVLPEDSGASGQVVTPEST